MNTFRDILRTLWSSRTFFIGFELASLWFTLWFAPGWWKCWALVWIALLTFDIYGLIHNRPLKRIFNFYVKDRKQL